MLSKVIPAGLFGLISAATLYFGGTSFAGTAYGQMGAAFLFLLLGHQCFWQRSQGKSFVAGGFTGLMLLGWIAALSVSTRYSLYFSSSVDTWALFTAGVLIFFIATNQSSYKSTLTLLAFIAMLAMAVAIAGIIFQWCSLPSLWSVPRMVYLDRLRATFVNPNHAANLFGMGICLSPVLFIRFWRYRILWFVGVFFLFLAFLMTKSLGAVLAAGAVSFAAGSLLVRSNKKRMILWSLTILGLIAALIFLKGNSEAMKQDYSFWQRINLCKGIADIVRSDEFPFFQNAKYFFLGAGPGTFRLLISPFYPQYDVTRFDHAHGEAFELFLESGLIGILFFGAFAVGLFIRVWRQIRIETEVAKRIGLISVLSAITFFLLHSLVEFNFRIPSNLFIFFTLAGCLCFQTAQPKPENRSVLTGAMLGLCLLSGLIFLISLRHLVAENLVLQARSYAAQENHEKAKTCFDSALRFDWHRASYHDFLGQYYLQRYGERMISQDEKKTSLADAISSFTEAIRLNPYLPESYFRLGWAYAAEGNFEKAWQFFDLGQKRNPRLLTTFLEAGRLALFEKDFEYAGEVFDRLRTELMKLPATSRRDFLLDEMDNLLKAYPQIPSENPAISRTVSTPEPAPF